MAFPNHRTPLAAKALGGLLMTMLLLVSATGLAANTPPLPPGFTGNQGPAALAAGVAPDAMWTDLGDAATTKNMLSTDRINLPQSYRLLSLDFAAMTAKLSAAPSEKAANVTGGVEITLPMPDGSFQRFRAVESTFLGPEVQALIPDFRSYIARGVDDPSAVLHLDTGRLGFRAYGRTASGTLWIDPWQLGSVDNYISAWKHDFANPGESWECGMNEIEADYEDAVSKAVPVSGNLLYTYRLAMSLTGEYSVYFGGTSNAINQAATTINRINMVYEIDTAVRFVFTNVLAYPDPATDPFPTGSSITGSILNQNQVALDTNVGFANYDIGHVLTQGGGGGLAGLGVVCTASKARGGTGRTTPTGDPFDIDYVAHEVGHQMGGSHTFNGSTGSCGGGNRSASNAFEPGSGSTIMAYAGICGTENLQPNSDPYFHIRSLEQIIAIRNASGCAVTTATGNTPPVADAGSDWTIPRGTAFFMTGNASDPDADALSYCWEQYDLGAASPPTNPYGPLFRSFNPTSGATRYFPDVSQVLAGSSDPFEVMPSVDSSLTLRLTVRDNAAAGGGVDDDEVEVTVSGDPFMVTSPNGGESFVAGQPVTVTWDVGGSVGTDVVIWVYSSAGFSVLADPTPNDGSEAVNMPCGITATNCRIWIQEIVSGSNNVHIFDVSDAVFTLTDGLPDYTPYTVWGDKIVANSIASGDLPTSLFGDTNSFISWSLANLGTAWPCETVYASANVDDVVVNSSTLGTAPGTWNGWINLPHYVSGGRHTAWQVLDAAGAQDELDETNNGYARQWVWEPSEITPGTAAIRTQPPERFAGSVHIPCGVTFFQNMDGLRVNDYGVLWQAMAVSSLDGSDYDAFLFEQSTGVENGFETPLVSSTFGGSSTDLVVANRALVPVTAYDAGLLRYNGSGNYVADLRNADANLAVGSQILAAPVAQDQIISMKTLPISNGEQGRNVIEIKNVSTPQTVDVLLFRPDLAFGSRSSAVVSATVNASGSVLIDYDFDVTGIYMLAVVRKASEGLLPFTYDVRFRSTPPDIATAVLAGSYGPVVPQIGTPISLGDPVPAPATLEGDMATTVLYFHIANNGPTDADLWDFSALSDGETIGTLEWPFGLPGGTTDITSQAFGGFPFTGGRHTTGMFFDSANEFDELFEDNNRYAEQWVWAPTQLALDGSIARNTPPQPMGGWDDIPVGLTMEPNADGLRTPAYSFTGNDGYLGGFAATPNPGSDIDLRVHALSTGAQDGFDTVLETSSQAGNATEFVLFDLDGPLPAGSAFDIGAQRVSGQTGYQAHATESLWLQFDPNVLEGQNFGPFPLDAGKILGLFEFQSSTLDGLDLNLSLNLVNVSGGADLALAVFGRTDASGFITPVEALVDGFSDDNGPGAGEAVQLVLPPNQYWAVAVYKTNGNETGKAAEFLLSMTNLTTSAVPEAEAMVAGIDNYPNPFNPQTKIDFVLEKSGRASVKIYDVQGRLVRTLVDGHFAAGAHSQVWQGTDDRGNVVASGVYMALFEHPDGAARQRMVLLK